uniref:Serpentine Receptor, class T n=2 Tax=Bursaphelenchus xylophilus TaxID=6326 RepID=A0A1I7SGJ7_BURXY
MWIVDVVWNERWLQVGALFFGLPFLAVPFYYVVAKAIYRLSTITTCAALRVCVILSVLHIGLLVMYLVIGFLLLNETTLADAWMKLLGFIYDLATTFALFHYLAFIIFKFVMVIKDEYPMELPHFFVEPITVCPMLCTIIFVVCQFFSNNYNVFDMVLQSFTLSNNTMITKFIEAQTLIKLAIMAAGLSLSAIDVLLLYFHIKKGIDASKYRPVDFRLTFFHICNFGATCLFFSIFELGHFFFDRKGYSESKTLILLTFIAAQPIFLVVLNR